jgi:2-polyprenyl-3-methyl-5-hydroxy-6-metoxy-1,4-benzoquinol methylase
MKRILRMPFVLKANLLAHGPSAFVSKVLRRAAYTLRTGYWQSGERPCPDFPDEIFFNSFKVYRFVSQFCNGERVLDVGCGTGYGTSYLGESANRAVGIDISHQAIRYARRHYGRPEVEFFRMSAESLTFADRSFDFIVSSENFEHLRDQRANLREMSRVLADEGMLLLATPNPEMFVGVRNPYHTHEFCYEELLRMVQGFFSECLIAENLLAPTTEEGQCLREERKRRGVSGTNLSVEADLWGKSIDTTWLSNTHSFFCFARTPRRQLTEQTSWKR